MMKCYIMIHHKVREYMQWQLVFNNSHDWRRDMGEKTYQIFTDTDDPQNVTLLLEWESVAQAKAFIADSALSEYMQHASVIDHPAVQLLYKV